jgi:flagellar biosynthesis anti-sigma factor FlgM
MPNRIKGVDAGAIGPSSGNPIAPVRPGTALGSAGTGAPVSGAADSVHITDSARALAALSQALQDSPDVDPVRVATLQQSIDSGQYSVSSQRIADRLLQLEQDLSAAQ